MQISWDINQGFVKDIIEHLPAPKPAYNTVSTIVRILEKKGFVSHNALGNSHEYYPTISKKDYTEAYLNSIIKDYFSDSFKRRITTMTKGKSKSRAKSKFLLMIPVICFLVPAFANPKPASSTDHSVGSKTIDLEESDTPVKIEEQKTSKEEHHKKQEELMKKEQEPKELLAKTDDPEKKKMIKKKLAEIQQEKQAEGWVENGPKIISKKEYAETTKKIKLALEKTEDPKKREQLEAKLEYLQEMKNKGLVKPANIGYEKEALMLKKMYEKEKDLEKKKKIKEKLAQVEQMAAKEKANKRKIRP